MIELRPNDTISTLLVVLLVSISCTTVRGEETPSVEGFQQLIPRGAIAALVDPTFVEAEKATLPDDAWVLGFAARGRAYAYDLNLLNAHEVVNHSIAGLPVAAVW